MYTKKKQSKDPTRFIMRSKGTIGPKKQKKEETSTNNKLKVR